MTHLGPQPRAANTNATRLPLSRQAAVAGIGIERDRAGALDERLAAIEWSWRWRVRDFGKALARRHPWVAVQVVRGCKLIWWSATFQLVKHLRCWVECRRRDLLVPMEAAALRQPEAVGVEPALSGVVDVTELTAAPHIEIRSEDIRIPATDARWQRKLESEHHPSGIHSLRPRNHGATRTEVILILDHLVPEPDRDAGSRVMWGLIRALLLDGFVVKFWPDNLYDHPVYAGNLRGMGVETFTGHIEGGFRSWMEQHGGDIDFVIASRPSVAAAHMDAIQGFTNCPLIYFGHDIHAARMRLQAEVTGDDALLSDANEMEMIERSVWRKSDAVVYLSQDEADTVAEMEPAATALWVTPYAYDEFPVANAPPGGQTVLFVAGFAHPPNVDAAIWLAQEIVPLVRDACPEVTFHLVGSNPTDQVLALADGTVQVTGYVPDERLDRYYRESRVAVVPLRFGAGVKSKVVEAIRAGLPLVTTRVGLQGLPGAADIVKCSASAAELAQQIVHLLTDDTAWTAQSRAQHDYAVRNFSTAALRESVRHVLERSRHRSVKSRRKS